MWLINIDTLKLEEFFGEKAPSYAIISHTWGETEATFTEWRKSKKIKRELSKHRPGYLKIIDACQFVKSKLCDVRYLWIDTACIDKRSSADLSEAINSMFAWYKNSAICLVYMADVNLPLEWDWVHPSQAGKPSTSFFLPNIIRQPFLSSRWFTRGWTLQELLAPKKLWYISKNWKIIGSHDEMIHYTSEASDIPADVLRGETPLNQITVAQKMAWAARRQTTRTEDQAYCLMGIFNVSMPLIYGEGSKAFLRLQEAIIKESHDHSIFMWDGEGRPQALAPSPSAFGAACRSATSSPSKSTGFSTSPLYLVKTDPYYITNIGVCMTLPIIPTADDQVFIAILECSAPSPQECSLPRSCLLIQKSEGENQYWVIGSMIVDMSGVFEGWKPSIQEALRRKVYLSTAQESVPSLSPYVYSTCNVMHAAEGNAFMLAYSWDAQTCSVTPMIPNSGTWKPWLVNSMKGVFRLRKTTHYRSVQALVLRLYNHALGQESWFAVGYCHTFGWSVCWLGHQAPPTVREEDIADAILTENSSFTPTWLDYRLTHPQFPSWPRVYEEKGDFSRCPLLIMQISSLDDNCAYQTTNCHAVQDIFSNSTDAWTGKDATYFEKSRCFLF